MKTAGLFAALALAACGHAAAPVAKTPPPPPPKPAAPALPPVDDALIGATTPIDHPFFYVAQKDGHTIHFQGTVHLGVEPTRLPQVVWDAIASSPTFVMETDVSDTSMMMQLMRTDGTTLDKELGPDYWAKLQAAIGDKLATGLNSFKTSVAATVLSVQGLPMTHDMDGALRAAAEKAGAKVKFLEEPSFQLALLDKWMDTRALEAMLDHPKDDLEETREMLTAYLRGDESGIAADTDDDKQWLAEGRTRAEFDQMNDEMLFGRNRDWIPKLETMAAQGDLFVAVGAAHLMGERGVLGLLRARGWKVERITPPAATK